MSVAAFKAALSSRDPQIRKAVREVPDGTYTAAELRELRQAAKEVHSDDSLQYAWPDCELAREAFTPEWLLPDEFKARLINPNPDVRRSVWLTMDDQPEDSPDYFMDVLTALDSQKYAYAWPDCRFVLDGYRQWGDHATLRPLIRVLASPTRDLGERLATVIGLPEGMFPPRWPVAITDSGTVECDFCSPNRRTRAESAANCMQVRTLVMLLSCSIEQLRLAAADELVQLGPGVAGILRKLRGTNIPGRRAALLALADLGWDEVSPADRVILDRLMRIQRVDEVARPVPNPRGTWYAIPTTDRDAVLEAFDLCDPVEVSLRAGFAMWDPAHRDRIRSQRLGLTWSGSTTPTPYADHYPEVFVTPALDGWTLILTDDYMLDVDDDYDRHAHRRCAELSRRFGTAHWYNHPADDFTYPRMSWCVAENGIIASHVTYDSAAGGAPDDYTPNQPQIGPGKRNRGHLRVWLTKRENGRHQPPNPAPPGDDLDDELPENFEFGVPPISDRLSVGLETLGPHTRIEGTGVLAVRADPRPPQRYGAPACS